MTLCYFESGTVPSRVTVVLVTQTGNYDECLHPVVARAGNHREQHSASWQPFLHW